MNNNLNKKFEAIETRMNRARELHDEFYTDLIIPDQIEMHQSPIQHAYTKYNKQDLLKTLDDTEPIPISDCFTHEILIPYHSFYLTIDLTKPKVIEYPHIKEICEKHGFEFGQFIVFKDGTPNNIHHLKNKLLIILRDKL